jgi:hypothetical protein
MIPDARACSHNPALRHQADKLTERQSPDSAELWVSIAAGADYDRTVAAIRQVVGGYPGVTPDLVTYPEEQIRRVQTGATDPLVVRVFGEDLGVLRSKAEEIRRPSAASTAWSTRVWIRSRRSRAWRSRSTWPRPRRPASSRATSGAPRPCSSPG